MRQGNRSAAACSMSAGVSMADWRPERATSTAAAQRLRASRVNAQLPPWQVEMRRRTDVGPNTTNRVMLRCLYPWQHSVPRQDVASPFFIRADGPSPSSPEGLRRGRRIVSGSFCRTYILTGGLFPWHAIGFLGEALAVAIDFSRNPGHLDRGRRRLRRRGRPGWPRAWPC